MLGGGTITAAGQRTSNTDDYSLAITGGTDAYERASGTAANFEHDAGDNHVLSLQLPAG